MGECEKHFIGRIDRSWQLLEMLGPRSRMSERGLQDQPYVAKVLGQKCAEGAGLRAECWERAGSSGH